MKENMYGPLLEKSQNIIKWKNVKMKFFDSEECQIASVPYKLKELKKLSYLKVIFIRAPKKNLQLPLMNWDNYDYYAIATNIFQHEMQEQEVIEFYRKRSNAENYIKEHKNGLDLKHFPCKPLLADTAYGLMGMIAYNFMRYTSFLINPKTGCFSKRIRFKFVNLACEIVKHARYLIVRFPKHIKKEVEHYLNSITLQFGQILLE